MSDYPEHLREAAPAVRAIQTCAALVRAHGFARHGLVGVAPDGMRLLLAEELYGADPDEWLAGEGITLLWRAAGGPGMAADLGSMKAEVLGGRLDLAMWPAAAPAKRPAPGAGAITGGDEDHGG